MQNLNKVTITLPPQSKGEVTTFGLYISNTITPPVGRVNLIYRGTYFTQNTSQVNVDVSSILRDMKYNFDVNVNTEYLYVKYLHWCIIVNDTYRWVGYDKILFQDIDIQTDLPVIESRGLFPVSPYITRFISHIPFIKTYRLALKTLIYNGTKDIMLKLGTEGGAFITQKLAGIGYHQIVWSLGDIFDNLDPSRLFIGTTQVATLDGCPDDYYVTWMYAGNWYCFGFKGKHYITDRIQRTELENLHDTTTISTIIYSITHELHSGYVDKQTFDHLKTILLSPDVKLYITNEDRLIDINPSMDEINDKTDVRGLYSLHLQCSERQKFHA